MIAACTGPTGCLVLWLRRERGRAGEQYRRGVGSITDGVPGQLYVATSSPDFKTAQPYMLRSNVTDQGGYPAALSAQGFITVNVKDITSCPCCMRSSTTSTRLQRAAVWTLPRAVFGTDIQVLDDNAQTR